MRKLSKNMVLLVCSTKVQLLFTYFLSTFQYFYKTEFRKSQLTQTTLIKTEFRKSQLTQTYGLAFLVGGTQSTLGDYVCKFY
jgi:hypothetical protein